MPVIDDQELAAFPLTRDVAPLWSLDPEVTFLNHGSFGACPLAVLELQQELRARMEREPVRFFVRELEPLLDAAREALGAFVGAPAADLGFVPNATGGVNAVLRSLDLRPGDELLTTDHEYNACRNALDYVAERSGALVVVARVPFPLHSPDEVVEAVVGAVSGRTRLALIDHVTSQTGLVFPVERLLGELAGRGVDTLIDGAHAPGMVDLDIGRLPGAAYYTGNCHKWLCAPKGAAFLYVRRDRQGAIHPACISHGRNSPRTDRSRFRLEFDWTGTCDPTPYLCVPAALRFMGSLAAGGWPALRARNRALLLLGRRTLCQALGIAPPCPEEMLGSMAALPLPENPGPAPAGDGQQASALYGDPLQDELLDRFGIEVPVVPWPPPPQQGRLVRISAQVYNLPAHYQRLADALSQVLRPKGLAEGLDREAPQAPRL